jgi:uncharacterized caspase-like protein
MMIAMRSTRHYLRRLRSERRFLRARTTSAAVGAGAGTAIDGWIAVTASVMSAIDKIRANTEITQRQIVRCLRHALLLSSCVLLLALLAHPARADRRVALVIGNGAYQHASTLPNALMDADAMAALLRNVGFEVTEGVDLKREGMMARLNEFAAKVQGADVALLYYAGHGIAVDGKNYLIPVDTDLNSGLDVKLGAAIDVAVAVEIMAPARVKLVFLDACRDNPFTSKIRAAARTRSVTILSGLTEMKPNEGTLIAFAAGPGETALDGKPGENSPFTRALLRNIAEPGVEISRALTKVRAQVSEETNRAQLPWENTNLTGFFYVNQQGATAAAAASIGAPTAPSRAQSNASNEIELEFWRSVRTSDRAQEYSAYLDRFPHGNFVSIARLRLAALQPAGRTNVQSINPALPTREAEELLGLDQPKRSAIQRRLLALGYFDGVADGSFNDGTRRAIERWQTARRYLKSGYFSKLQYEALLAERLASIHAAAPAIARQQPAMQPQPARSAAAPAPPVMGCETWRLPPGVWLWARQPCRVFVGQHVEPILPQGPRIP